MSLHTSRVRASARDRSCAPAILAAVLLSTLPLAAGGLAPASAAESRGQGTIHILGAFPQGEFSDNIEDPGGGIGGSFLAHLPGGPVYLGLEAAYFLYGQTERTEPFNPNIPEVRIKVRTENSLVQGGLVLRLMPPDAPVRPYLDALVGFNYLFTKTSIRNYDGDEEIASDTNQDDGAFAWGGGGGLLLRVYHARPEKEGIRGVYIDGRARYVAGGEADYLREGSIRREGDRLVYERFRSRTDVIQGGVGVTLEF